MTGQQTSLSIEMNGPGAVLYSEPQQLSICRPPISPWEAVELSAAIVTLHAGNVLRQALRPVENKSGLRFLGKLGMSEQPRELIDYRPTHHSY